MQLKPILCYKIMKHRTHIYKRYLALNKCNILLRLKVVTNLIRNYTFLKLELIKDLMFVGA